MKIAVTVILLIISYIIIYKIENGGNNGDNK